MKKLFVSSLIVGLIIFGRYAQAQPENRLVAGFDIGGGWKEKAGVVSGQYNQYLKIDRKGILQVGWGVRGTRFMGKEQNFITAPASLTRGKSGLGAIGAPLILRQIDTLQLRSSITSFNFNLGFQVSLGGRIDIGVNTDLLGLAFGTRRSGYYSGSRGYNKVDSLNLHKTSQQARPSSLGFRLLGDNTIGNLHTELYARLHITQQIGLKVSYLFTVNEYQTDRTLTDDNRRFRLRSPMIYVGLYLPMNL